LCWENFSTATELANYLVSDRGLAFREAHHVTGSLVGALVERGTTLRETAAVAGILHEQGHDVNEATLTQLLDPRNAVTSYTSTGGTSPQSVRAVWSELTAAVRQHREWAARARTRITSAEEATLRAAQAVVGGVDIGKAVESVLTDLPDTTA
jgi:argininosuccinate lyase